MKKFNALIADWSFTEKAKPLKFSFKSDLAFLRNSFWALAQ